MIRRCILILLLGQVLVTLTACSDRLLRENVFANTESMVGVQLAQDPRAGLYQLRAGFARHELFMVPTGKHIAYDREGGEAAVPSSTAADVSPDVLGEIMVDGTLGIDPEGAPARVGVYQRLAVGKVAVAQPAAIALFARDQETAHAAAGLAAFEFGGDAASDRIRRWLEGDPARREAINRWLAATRAGPERVRLPALLNSAAHAPLRAQAIIDLGIPE